MRLWMWYAPGTDEQIAQACEIAEALLARRDLTPELAFQAAASANALTDDHVGESTPNADKVEAWYAAEFAALSHLAELCGEWPAQASLIVVEPSE